MPRFLVLSGEWEAMVSPTPGRESTTGAVWNKVALGGTSYWVYWLKRTHWWVLLMAVKLE